jgi:hypothetical protein
MQHDEWLRLDNSYDAKDYAKYQCSRHGIIYALAAGLDEAESDGADTTSHLS